MVVYGRGAYFDNYMISIVAPVREGMGSIMVQVYEKLDSFDDHDSLPTSKVEHVRFVGEFPMHDLQKDRSLSLDEVVNKVHEIVAKQKVRSARSCDEVPPQ